MKNLALAGPIAFAVSSCATRLPVVSYEKVAEQLEALNGCAPQYCHGMWYPLDRPRDNKADQQSELAISECIVQLNKGIESARPQYPPNDPSIEAGHAPNDIVAAAQIVTCMREKGWQYSVQGMIIM